MKRKQLRELYKLSPPTFAVWLALAGIKHNRRKLTPAEVRAVKTHLGEPEAAFTGEIAAKSS